MSGRNGEVRNARLRSPTGPVVRSSDAIWLEGPVPSGYWDSFEHRLLYMRWLGQRLGYRRPDDWYRIRTDDFKQNRGASVMANYWNSSAIAAVKASFPDRDWKDWLFATCPRRFWKIRRNHRAYMKWLAAQLNIRRPDDWYRVTNKDFTRHKGGAFLLEYRSTVSAAVMACHPRYPWKEWLFDKTPKKFWKSTANRRRYMDWLGERIGVRQPDDWYAVTVNDFKAHRGRQFLKLYRNSPLAAVKHLYPDHDWQEWRFARVPFGYWRKAKNRRRYIQWLGEQLGIKKQADWRQVRRSDFLRLCGGGLLETLHASYFDLLAECVRGIRWDRERKKRARGVRSLAQGSNHDH